MKKTIAIIFCCLLFCNSAAFAYQGAVVSAHPLASRAGLNVLKQGGSAADAAIAMAFSLAVVEPHHSGLGGGGFLLYFDSATRQIHFLDYREVAPRAISQSYYTQNPLAKDGGIHSVGVPGFVKGMDVIHQRWGRVDWHDLIQPAINQAGGFVASKLLREKIATYRESLLNDPGLKNIFLGPLKQPLRQLDLAKSLQEIQQTKSDGFYAGYLAKRIVGFMQQQGAKISLADFKNYRVRWHKPYVFSPKAGIQIYSAPLPSSGGLGIHKMFQLAQEYPTKSLSKKNRLAIFEAYFKEREMNWGDQKLKGQTTHLCVIDRWGNMVAMTNTINDNFGAKIMVPGTGIILNNELGDFSLNKQSANFIRGGARPLSSMSPTFLFDNGRAQLIIGTPGGRSIPQNIFQVLWSYQAQFAPLKKAIKQKKVYFDPIKQRALIENATTGPFGNVQAIEVLNQTQSSTISDPRGEGIGLRQ